MEDCAVKVAVLQRDIKVQDLEKIINHKNKYLLEKRNEVNKKKSINKFLEGVHDDYNKYFKFISDQKEEQLRSLQLLNQYISSLAENQKIVENENLVLEKDRQIILTEIDAVKNELEQLISGKMN